MDSRSFFPDGNSGSLYESRGPELQYLQIGPPAANVALARGNNPSVGAFYSAFVDCDREYRQRNFMIAEYEVKIEVLKTTLAERKSKNKELQVETETLQMEAQAAQTDCEKSAKEKSLIEKEYQELCKEMDRLFEAKKRRETLLEKVNTIRKNNAEFCKRKEQEFLAEYMKNPKVAELVKLREDMATHKKQINELNVTAHELNKTKENLAIEYKDRWCDFKKKCLKMAGLRLEILEKANLNRKLESESKKPLLYLNC